MATIILDANAVIMHGQAFHERVKKRTNDTNQLILPRSIKQELVDDVLNNLDAPPNHTRSANDIQELIDEGYLTVRAPDFERYGHIADEARRRIADATLPEHAVKADQYIPALVCEIWECGICYPRNCGQVTSTGGA